jgi:hypothetical protein
VCGWSARQSAANAVAGAWTCSSRKLCGLIEQRHFDREFNRLGHLSKKPLSDNEIDDRLKAARAVLGEEHGATVPGETALAAARKALELLSLGLIAAGLKQPDA